MLWEDVDLDAGRITVNHAVRLEGRRAVTTDDLKTARSRRTLDVPADVVAMLRRLRIAQAARRLAATSWTDDRLVFASRKGTQLDPANVRHELARVCEVADVPVVLPNELRHSVASIMSEQGAPLEQIADQLGHTNTHAGANVPAPARAVRVGRCDRDASCARHSHTVMPESGHAHE